MLENTPNQLIKFREKNWVEVNDDLRGTYNTNGQTKFKISMLRSSFCDYSDAYILVRCLYTYILAEANNAAKRLDEGNKGMYQKIVYHSLIGKVK